jgi:hypothetical protein
MIGAFRGSSASFSRGFTPSFARESRSRLRSPLMTPVTCTMSCSQVLMPRPCTASYAARFREIILVAFRTKVAKCNARPKGELEALEAGTSWK